MVVARGDTANVSSKRNAEIDPERRICKYDSFRDSGNGSIAPSQNCMEGAELTNVSGAAPRAPKDSEHKSSWKASRDCMVS